MPAYLANFATTGIFLYGLATMPLDNAITPMPIIYLVWAMLARGLKFLPPFTASYSSQAEYACAIAALVVVLRLVLHLA